ATGVSEEEEGQEEGRRKKHLTVKFSRQCRERELRVSSIPLPDSQGGGGGRPLAVRGGAGGGAGASRGSRREKGSGGRAVARLAAAGESRDREGPRGAAGPAAEAAPGRGRATGVSEEEEGQEEGRRKKHLTWIAGGAAIPPDTLNKIERSEMPQSRKKITTANGYFRILEKTGTWILHCLATPVIGACALAPPLSCSLLPPCGQKRVLQPVIGPCALAPPLSCSLLPPCGQTRVLQPVIGPCALAPPLSCSLLPPCGQTR
ncbi:unnamed protein product, partial [Bubo scandiacus]